MVSISQKRDSADATINRN